MEAARRALVRQFERHTVRKRYLALVEGTLAPEAGEIDAPLKRDPLDRRRVIVASDGQPSLTRYRVVGLAPIASPAPPVSLVMAEPVTGRTHQIRAHLAARGAVILGDATYRALAIAHAAEDGLNSAQGEAHDAAMALTDTAPIISAQRVMLHAWRLTCRYPQAPANASVATPSQPPAPFVVTAPIPVDMLALIGQLGLGAAPVSLGDVE
jgi:23S rRNA-/tRNA-specific pseudouridylate synthase